MTALTPVRKILVPVDFSEPSERALSYALELASRLDAHVLVMHVWEPPRAVGPDFGLYPIGQGEVQQILEEEVSRRLKRFAGQAVGADDPQPDTLVVQGIPYEAIVDAAEGRQIDLIVMGTHGRSGLKHFFLGSVAEKVVRHAACPVLTIRERAAKPGQSA